MIAGLVSMIMGLFATTWVASLPFSMPDGSASILTVILIGFGILLLILGVFQTR